MRGQTSDKCPRRKWANKIAADIDGAGTHRRGKLCPKARRCNWLVVATRPKTIIENAKEIRKCKADILADAAAGLKEKANQEIAQNKAEACKVLREI